jgi:hypothetical protein
MELTKRQWTVIAVIGGLVAIYFLFIRKKKMPVSESSFNDALPLIGDSSYSLFTRGGKGGVYQGGSTGTSGTSGMRMTNEPKGKPVIETKSGQPLPESNYNRRPTCPEGTVWNEKTKICEKYSLASSNYSESDINIITGESYTGAGALNRSVSSNYVPMTKATTYPKQDPGKGNKWCCNAYGVDGNCKQWVITPMAKKC